MQNSSIRTRPTTFTCAASGDGPIGTAGSHIGNSTTCYRSHGGNNTEGSSNCQGVNHAPEGLDDGACHLSESDRPSESSSWESVKRMISWNWRTNPKGSR